MFNDSKILDLKDMRWEGDESGQPPSLSYDICANLYDGIESVPHHKIFSFGGKTDMMMQFSNRVEVMDAGNQIWQQPHIEEGPNPLARYPFSSFLKQKMYMAILCQAWMYP